MENYGIGSSGSLRTTFSPPAQRACTNNEKKGKLQESTLYLQIFRDDD